jgi:hypothetical protein
VVGCSRGGNLCQIRQRLTRLASRRHEHQQQGDVAGRSKDTGIRSGNSQRDTERGTCGIPNLKQRRLTEATVSGERVRLHMVAAPIISPPPRFTAIRYELKIISKISTAVQAVQTPSSLFGRNTDENRRSGGHSLTTVAMT